MEEILNKIQTSIKNKKLNLSNEKLLQNDLEKYFKESNLDFKREFKIGSNSILDFFIDGLAIEVKIQSKSSNLNIYKQLEKYSEFEEIKNILLITSKSLSLPSQINNKPLYILNLSKSQL